jgi:phosphoribosylaminoimidazole (AIR) synthetase
MDYTRTAIRWRENLVRQNAAQSHLAPARAEQDCRRGVARVHKNYQPLLAKVPRAMIKGLAHITGGGLIDNVPRICLRIAMQ